MPPIYKEASFPPHYRQDEVRQIMDAVYKRRSIAITGLAGMGKSNVVRFIVSHPLVGSRYLKERADDTAFVHVDCAGLADWGEGEILSEIAAQLHDDGITTDVPGPPSTPRNARRALKRQILNVAPELNLALVLDYFDEAAADLDRTFYNYLFHLRNTRPNGNLSYIFATRRPMGHLYELHELLDDGCAVGPLGYRDALDSLRRDEARLGCAFDAAQRDRLIACTGGHPGFLKNASELLASGRADSNLPAEELAAQLLPSEKIKNLCAELWGDLTPEEQRIVRNVARSVPASEPVDGDRVACLERWGVLVREKEQRGQPRLAIFCPLFETFVRGASDDADAVRIKAVFPNQAQIEAMGSEQRVTLSPRLFALLLALAEAPGQVRSADEIIIQVYGDEAVGVSNAALSQLVKRLRGALDPHVRRMTGDPTLTCVETVRDVGYRLEG